MTATLGDFLLAAERRFTEAEAGPAPGTRDHEALAVQARRMVTVLGRYLDTVLDAATAADRIPKTWQQTSEIRAGLRTAAACLERAIGPARSAARTGVYTDDPVAVRYTRAVNALAAGSELLRTHLTVGGSGQPEPRSDWAQVLAAPLVITALTEMIVTWASRAEQLTARLVQAPEQEHHLSVPGLTEARDRLAAITQTGSQRGSREDEEGMEPAARRHLLFSVPVMMPPERSAPTGPESDEQLCAGIGGSAQRLRTAAFTVSREPRQSPALSGLSWKHEAHSAAVICDLAARTLQSLADQPPPTVPAIRLLDAASCLITAREGWRHVAWMWQAMSTDTNSPVSRTVIETSDLAVRLGRLLTGNPAWKPGRGNLAWPRAAGSLAPGDTALALVVGAVHEAADAVTRTGRADMTALAGMHHAHRLYIQTEAVGDLTVRYRYIPAPADRVHMLRNAYYLCTEATWQAARRLDTLALDTGAPSTALTLIRAALPAGDHVTDPETGFEIDPDAFNSQLDLFTRFRGTWGRRRSELNPEAVIRAYEEEHLTLEECGQSFAISASRVASVLTEHGHRPRTRSEARQQALAEEPAPPAPPPAREPADDERSPLYRQLRGIGITDPALLLRAAAIDKAAADVLQGASEELQADKAASRRKRTAAQLAAMDGPRDATQAVQHAAAADSRAQKEDDGQLRQPSQNVPRARPPRA